MKLREMKKEKKRRTKKIKIKIKRKEHKHYLISRQQSSNGDGVRQRAVVRACRGACLRAVVRAEAESQREVRP